MRSLLTSHHQECFPFLDGNNKYGSHGRSHHRATVYLRCPRYDKTGNSVSKINSSFKIFVLKRTKKLALRVANIV